MRKLPRIGALLAAATAAFGVLFAEGTLRLNTPDPRAYPVRGLDVSHHQGAIDWARLGPSGLRFVFIKATEGGDFLDPRFSENWRDAGQAGLMRGAYHFFTLCRPGDEQADHFLRVVPDAPELPAALDLEFGGNCAARPPPDQVAAEIAAFLHKVDAAHGRSPILYTTYEFLDGYLRGRFLDRELWIRDVFLRPRLGEERRWSFWQHHNRGRVDGITGPVDLNVFAGDEAAWQQAVSWP